MKRKLKRKLKREKQLTSHSRDKALRFARKQIQARALIAENSGKEVRVSLVRSLIGTLPVQRKTARALGLGRISSSSTHLLTASSVGMLRQILHLIDVQLIEGSQ